MQEIQSLNCFHVKKIHDFFFFFFFLTIQFLIEIKVGESRVSKSAYLTNLEALNLDFYEFLHFLSAEMLTNQQNSELLKWQKRHFLNF